MIQLDYRDSRPIYAQIVDGFRGQIAGGILENGQRLPSVRELAAELTINPNTIQRAYRELEAAGWIATVAGKGCFVCGVPSQEQRSQQVYWKRFEDAAAALQLLGVSKKELIKRLEGEHHA